MKNLSALLLSVFLLFAVAPFASADNMPAAATQIEININQADAETLAQLKGVGDKKAEAIVAWRDANGPFTSAEQLLEVKGIGQAILAQNKQVIVLE